MKKQNSLHLISAFVLCLILLQCKKDESSTDETQLPVVITHEITDVRTTSARGGGEISVAGHVSIMSRGLIWGTLINPEFGNNEGAVTAGTGMGSFTASLKGLQPGTEYYARAFANHSLGTAYGNQVQFSTTGSSGGSGSTAGKPCPELPEFVDPRDGKQYKTVLIGNQCWMKENLNLETEGSWCYNRNETNCDDFGRLYTWLTAMNDELSSNSVPSNVQGICPSGWHLPSDNEWKILEMFVDSKHNTDIDEWEKNGFRGFDAGKNLKATDGWNFDGNGSDSAGFLALPGGRRFYFGQYYTRGTHGYWWTSTAHSEEFARYRYVYYNSDKVYRFHYGKDNGLSVRCVKN
jgi:uncharacterized protein (TIGR02145 family)